jgi:hypothetical protein
MRIGLPTGAGLRVRNRRRRDSVHQPTARRHVGDHHAGQQRAVLNDVDAAVGEAAFVAQPDDVELEILGGVAARDEVR